jgi:hypothetical protein
LALIDNFLSKLRESARAAHVMQVQGLFKILFEEVGIQMFSEDGQGLCCPSFRGGWFHHWGARTEESLDWAEREPPSRTGGRAKRPEVAEWSTWVEG